MHGQAKKYAEPSAQSKEGAEAAASRQARRAPRGTKPPAGKRARTKEELEAGCAKERQGARGRRQAAESAVEMRGNPKNATEEKRGEEDIRSWQNLAVETKSVRSSALEGPNVPKEAGAKTEGEGGRKWEPQLRGEQEREKTSRDRKQRTIPWPKVQHRNRRRGNVRR